MDASPQSDDLLTTKQAAALLQITTRTLQQWVRNGSIQAYRVGRGFRFKRSELVKPYNAPSAARVARADASMRRSQSHVGKGRSPSNAPRDQLQQLIAARLQEARESKRGSSNGNRKTPKHQCPVG